MAEDLGGIVLRLRNQAIDRKIAALEQRLRQPQLGETERLESVREANALRAQLTTHSERGRMTLQWGRALRQQRGEPLTKAFSKEEQVRPAPSRDSTEQRPNASDENLQAHPNAHEGDTEEPF